MFKYALMAVALTLSAAAAEQTPQPPANGAEPDWSDVISCYNEPKTAIGCLEARMGSALGSLRDDAVGMARGDPEAATEDVTGMGELVQQIGEFISYGISSYFRAEEEEVAAASAGGAATPANDPTDMDEGRGHHKKKKIQKEIKKFVLKILFGIYLFKQKIKMILMSIQSILMSKFLIVAMIYALSNTFKIWYDIKWSHKHHHHDKVVYYENAHHQHHYEPPEHEYDDHHHDHHGWGGDWGRSIAVTESPSLEQPTGGVLGGVEQGGISRFIRRVTRTVTPDVTAQTIAYSAQRPRDQ